MRQKREAQQREAAARREREQAERAERERQEAERKAERDAARARKAAASAAAAAAAAIAATERSRSQPPPSPTDPAASAERGSSTTAAPSSASPFTTSPLGGSRRYSLGPLQPLSPSTRTEPAAMAASGHRDIIEPFHAIPNDLLSGPLAEGPSDPLLRAQSGAQAAADSLASLFATSQARFPFSSSLGAPADALTTSAAPYAPVCSAQAAAYDPQPPLLSSLHTPSASAVAGSFARPLTPSSPLGSGMLLPRHSDSPRTASAQPDSRQYLPIGSASYGPSATVTGCATESIAQRGRSLGGPGHSLADDLWPRQQPAAAAGVGAGLDWGACLPGNGARRTSRLSHDVRPGAFGNAASPRSQATYAVGDEAMYGSDRGVGLLPGDEAAVWGRPQQEGPAEEAGMLQVGELAGRWPEDLRRAIGTDPGGLWVFAPPASTAADRREHDTMSGLGAAAARMHAAAAANTPAASLAGLDRAGGQGLFAFGAPGASVFGAGGSSWSALPEPQAIADRGQGQGSDEGAGYRLMDMPNFMQRDVPYGGQGALGAMDPGGGGVGSQGMPAAADIIMQESVRSAAGSQWSEGSQAQRKTSEFNVHAAEFQVRRPARMSSKELCLPSDLIE